MYLSFVTHIPEDGHMSGWNLWEMYSVRNILLYACVYLLVLISYHSSNDELWSFISVTYLFYRRQHTVQRDCIAAWLAFSIIAKVGLLAYFFWVILKLTAVQFHIPALKQYTLCLNIFRDGITQRKIWSEISLCKLCLYLLTLWTVKCVTVCLSAVYRWHVILAFLALWADTFDSLWFRAPEIQSTLTKCLLIVLLYAACRCFGIHHRASFICHCRWWSVFLVPGVVARYRDWNI